MQRKVIVSYRHFGITYRSHHQGSSSERRLPYTVLSTLSVLTTS